MTIDDATFEQKSIEIDPHNEPWAFPDYTGNKVWKSRALQIPIAGALAGGFIFTVGTIALPIPTALTAGAAVLVQPLLFSIADKEDKDVLKSTFFSRVDKNIHPTSGPLTSRLYIHNAPTMLNKFSEKYVDILNQKKYYATAKTIREYFSAKDIYLVAELSGEALKKEIILRRSSIQEKIAEAIKYDKYPVPTIIAKYRARIMPTKIFALPEQGAKDEINQKALINDLMHMSLTLESLAESKDSMSYDSAIATYYKLQNIQILSDFLNDEAEDRT